ncbi:ABC transporter permease [Herbiconiux moechotypicola]|uniref:Iron export ABC transporter permease subunit FetB n=1 Tax=Herbiconiux moechotypicola TaxID=637393 RepID=A0ABP5QBY4_9MICO|nr:ABC transporter permease [Herbiconiux moechotypicola]MCS5729248.1 ABC transporter permease [Herbiconiux moechotypicola]
MSLLSTGLAVLALTAVTFALVARLRLERPWLQPWAIVRACVQLGILSLLLTGIIADPRWVAVFLVVMVLAATAVSARRLEVGMRGAVVVLLVIAVSAAVPLGVVFTLGAVGVDSRSVLALAGIVIGGTMTVTTLMGRQLNAALSTQHDEIEGWLALGATPRRATQRLVRMAASTALVPSTDQTRTTGIVTLPGAFVGAVFAGASPLEAAQFQVIVLSCILLAAAIAVTLVSAAFGAPATLRTPASAATATPRDAIDPSRSAP